ncbi:pyrroline-5-carboxylate reductase [Pyrenophora seminiperda CCB06]|uniref:Pyrroline-5-carboxylate reductase n=1 Tax=Pyrenophora seminiperda CCB06 TaxID=1302712 RepID=A0A3M7M9C9_9PLEO|nr:pyrroline-5-carboxylate reductase [Pyrenophora seminiperda CCB06]
MLGHILMCFVGNLGTAILKSLIKVPSDSPVRFDRFTACVRSESSLRRLEALAEDSKEYLDCVSSGLNAGAVKGADVVILGVDPSQVEATLKEEGMNQALVGKLLISVVAGWSRERLESIIRAKLSEEEATRIWVVRTLPNVAAQVSQSLTAIEEPAVGFPQEFMDVVSGVFSHIGKPVRVEPRLMAATTAVGGSTPAFWAIICDALIDAAVAVGLPRHIAQAQIYQSMRGTVEMLQSGMQPGELRDMGTSPEGCTIGGVMVLEEMGVRGALGKALRESVTIARAMEKDGAEQHVNDTRRL